MSHCVAFNKKILFGVMIAIIVILVSAFITYSLIEINLFREINLSVEEIEQLGECSGGNYEEVEIDGKIYYQRLDEKNWEGKYQKEVYFTEDSNNIQKVVSYEEYFNIIKEINKNIKPKISSIFKNTEINYIILSYANGMSWCRMDLIDCKYEENKIIVYGQESIHGVMAGGSGYFIAIPTQMPVGTNVEYRNCSSTEELDKLRNSDNFDPNLIFFDPGMVDYKPIIYIYPEEEIELTVKLGKKENITCSYPKYEDGWRVIAKPDGTLIDVTTQRELYALYWEGIHSEKIVEDEGFIVKGEETIEFLEEKLKILGLNAREAEEFIIYWLPKLEANKYNYIRFATQEEIDKNMPLEISEEPDTIIRVLMQYKGLEEPIKIKEQRLEEQKREGFTVVEWGGTEIKE